MNKRIITLFAVCCMAIAILPAFDLSAKAPHVAFKRIDAVSVADPMPTYPGGIEAFEEYINHHLTFPTDPFKLKDYTNIPVEISLTIMSDGTIGAYNVFKPAGHPYLDLSGLNSIFKSKDMPKFKPGKVNGKPVNVKMMVKITINPPASE